MRYATPEGRFTVPMPTYPEIRLALFPRARLEKEIRDFAPDAVHIATEGTLGLSARAICIKYGIAFSTSFHTRFPEYVKARFPFVPLELVYRWLRWFHGPATAMMVATESLKREMAGAWLSQSAHLVARRGCGAFPSHRRRAACPMTAPIWLYVGRVAVEKNIEAFLALDLPGTKVVVGDGPARAAAGSRNIPQVRFLGALTGEELVRAYAGSDCLRLSQPHRHLRAGAAGSPGLRHSGGGLSGARARWMWWAGCPARPVAALDEDLEAACLEALEIAQQAPAPPPGPSPWSIPGGPAPCSSCAISWSSPTRTEGPVTAAAFRPAKAPRSFR